MGRQKVFNWIELETEFILSDYEALAPFFLDKQIPIGTFAKHTKGWLEKRKSHLLKSAQLALKKGLTSRSNQVLDMRSDAKLMRDKAVYALGNGNAIIESGRDAALIIKAAHELISDAFELEAPTQKTEELLGVSVGITTGEGADQVRTEIKLIARDISRSRIRRMGGGLPLLGASEHSDS